MNDRLGVELSDRWATSRHGPESNELSVIGEYVGHRRITCLYEPEIRLNHFPRRRHLNGDEFA